MKSGDLCSELRAIILMHLHDKAYRCQCHCIGNTAIQCTRTFESPWRNTVKLLRNIAQTHHRLQGNQSTHTHIWFFIDVFHVYDDRRLLFIVPVLLTSYWWFISVLYLYISVCHFAYFADNHVVASDVFHCRIDSIQQCIYMASLVRFVTVRALSGTWVNSAFRPSGVGKSSTSLHRLGLRRGVPAYVGLQVKLCDTILRWHWHPVVLRWLDHEELIRL